ncbi:MAG: hypothetical protein OEW00_07490 [candidate division Zixibacteria bacterium]|nr:hypothetical protein [candidate division Zixibacteria bacterium]
MNRIAPSPKNTCPSTATARPLTFCLAAILALYVTGGVAGSYYTWGFDFWGIFDNPLVYLFPALAMVFLVPAVYRPLYKAVEPLLEAAAALFSRQRRFVSVALVSLALLALFYLLRSRAHVYGDGFIVLAKYGSGESILTGYQEYLKGFSLPFYHVCYLALSAVSGLAAEQIFALTSAAGGVVGFWGVYKLSGVLTTDAASRRIIIAAAFTSACAILFFGYVEYYTWPTALGLWTLYYAVRYVKFKKGIVPLVISGVLTMGFHLLAAPYLLVAMVAVLYRRGDREGLPWGLSFRYLSVIAIGGSFLLALGTQLLNLPQWLMPISRLADVPYWFLSPGRLVDVANLALLVAPLGTLLFLGWVLTRKRKTRQDDIETKLLGTAALLTFLVAFWVEPKLGAARDWDFSSLFGFPLTLWGLSWILGRGERRCLRPALIVPVTVTALVALAPNLMEKNDLKAASARLDDILWDSPHHQVAYADARRAMVWAVVLYNDVGDLDRASRNFHRRLSADSTCFASWFNLGQIYYDRQVFDSSAHSFARAVQFDPDNPIYLARLAEVEYKLGLYRQAVQHIDLSAAIKPDEYNTQLLYGLILAKIDQYTDAVARFQYAGRLKPGEATPMQNIGLLYNHLEQPDSMYMYLDKARVLNPDNPALYEPLTRAALASGRLVEAGRLLDILERIKPDLPEIGRYRQLLRR